MMICDDITQSYRDRKTNIRIFFHQIYPNIYHASFVSVAVCGNYLSNFFPRLSKQYLWQYVAVVFFTKWDEAIDREKRWVPACAFHCI